MYEPLRGLGLLYGQHRPLDPLALSDVRMGFVGGGGAPQSNADWMQDAAAGLEQLNEIDWPTMTAAEGDELAMRYAEGGGGAGYPMPADPGLSAWGGDLLAGYYGWGAADPIDPRDIDLLGPAPGAAAPLPLVEPEPPVPVRRPVRPGLLHEYWPAGS